MKWLQQLRHNHHSIYKSIILSPAATSVYLCELKLIGAPFIFLHFPLMPLFTLLFSPNSAQISEVVSLPDNLLCRHVFLHEHACRCVGRHSFCQLDSSPLRSPLYLSNLLNPRGPVDSFNLPDICFHVLPSLGAPVCLCLTGLTHF